MNIKFEDVTIEFPSGFDDDFTNEQLVEWLNYEFGLCGEIPYSNPLCKVELRDCDINVRMVTIND